jgi:hypothetical protein
MIMELAATTAFHGPLDLNHEVTGARNVIARPTSQNVRAIRHTLGGELFEAPPALAPTMLGE